MSKRSFPHSRSTSRSLDNVVIPSNTLPSRSFGIQAKPSRRNHNVGSHDDLNYAQQFGHDLTTVVPGIQAKLTVGAPGDRYEQEADQVASQVVQQIHSPQGEQAGTVQRDGAYPDEEKPLQAKPAISILQRSDVPEEDDLQAKPLAETIQRQDIPEEEEETLQTKPDIQRQDIPEAEDETVQTKPDLQRETLPEEEENLQKKPLIQAKASGEMAASQSVESTISSARGQGQPLSDETRGQMEGAFGADFGGVRVHTDGRSDQLNQSLQARAFTTGQDIFFKQSEFNPRSRGGQELLAHELTHVLQQQIPAKHPSPQTRATGINQRANRAVNLTFPAKS